jgi:DNA-binding LytR/AlgR family response regulator
MKIVIIEDEKLTARDLARTIKAVESDTEILPFIYSVEEARLFFSQKIPIDLIFSDIELGDGLSFDIFEQLQIKIPIVFCTAYEEYTLKAFKNFGIDYIIKPFQKAHVEEALLKYKDLETNFNSVAISYSHLLDTIQGTGSSHPQSLLIHQGDKIIPIAIDEIDLFFVENEQVYALVGKDQKYPIPDTLNVLEKSFPHFFRANRQFLISRRAVQDASHYFNRKLLINLRFPFSEPVVVSRLKAGAFLAWLAAKSHQ